MRLLSALQVSSGPMIIEIAGVYFLLLVYAHCVYILRIAAGVIKHLRWKDFKGFLRRFEVMGDEQCVKTFFVDSCEENRKDGTPPGRTQVWRLDTRLLHY